MNYKHDLKMKVTISKWKMKKKVGGAHPYIIPSYETKFMGLKQRLRSTFLHKVEIFELCS